jgi:DNA (cytosine-5)-methyltransferase 1
LQKGITADTTSERTRKLSHKSQTAGTQKSDELLGKQHSIPNWDNFPTQSPVCSRNDGLSHKLDDITFSKWRNESIKALGNAIVPQIAYQIFKAIEFTESQK